MITIKIDQAQLKAKVRAKAAEVLEAKFTDMFVDLTAPPPEGTPVDTGQARNGWQLDVSQPLNPKITNPLPYIGRLNDGHSSQSPAGFIDAIADKHRR